MNNKQQNSINDQSWQGNIITKPNSTMNKGIVRQWFMQLKANNSSQQEFEKWLRFMRLVVAAASRACVVHPTAKFQQQEQDYKAMALVQPQHKQAKHELMWNPGQGYVQAKAHKQHGLAASCHKSHNTKFEQAITTAHKQRGLQHLSQFAAWLIA